MYAYLLVRDGCGVFFLLTSFHLDYQIPLQKLATVSESLISHSHNEPKQTLADDNKLSIIADPTITINSNFQTDAGPAN